MAKKAARPRLGAGGAAHQNSRQAARQNLAAATTEKGGAAEQNLTTAKGLLPIQPKKQKSRRPSAGKWQPYDYESAYELPLDQLTEQQVQEMIDRERRVVYATKTVKHGHQFDVEIFPDFTHLPGNLPRDRSNREAQRNLNDRNSRKECERRINENFGPDDYWVTLTCLPREEPQTMEDALRLFQNYIKRINYRRKKRGLEPARYVYVTDWTKNGRRVRTHYHLVLDGGLPMDEVIELWGLGRKNTVEYLTLDERGLSGLAYYITKPHASDTEDIKHKKRWTASKNLRRPVEHKNHQAFGRRKGRTAKKGVKSSMKQTAYFSEKPDVVTVCVLPTEASDVWLRRNIVEKQIADTTDGEAMTQWECEEVYARHGEKLTPEIVQERFDDYWAVGENWPEASPDQPSDHERLVALEAAMVDMLLGGGDDDDV